MRPRASRAVAVLALLVESSAFAVGPVVIEAHLPATSRVGEAVPLRLSFTNRGDDALYIDFSGADYGIESLTICAQGNEQLFRTGQVHLDRDVASHRFDFVPLRHGQRFESPVFAINDPMAGALPVLRLPDPGVYEIFVRYESRGSAIEGVLWPIWRGVATSFRIPLKVTAPSREVLTTNRLALSACAVDANDCEPGVIGYFAIVRDKEAAGLLIGMLNQLSVPDPLLAGAVANQGDDRSADALRQFAIRFPIYGEFVANLLLRREDASVCAENGKSR